MGLSNKTTKNWLTSLPHAQNVQNVDATMTLRLAPKDLQFLMESIRATVALSVPTTPPPELEGKKTPGYVGF